MSDALRGAVLGAARTAGDVLVRNHDLTTDHHVAVRLHGPTGDTAYESGFDLAPGAAAARPADLAAGSYTVEVDVDADRYLVTTSRLDESEGLLVAVGSGVVDVAARPAP